MKQNLLIIGLIDNFGGREVEVSNIIVALSKVYNVKLISLLEMSNESVAIKDLDCNATNIFKELYRSCFKLKVFAFLSKVYNRSKLPSYFFIENNISKKLFNIFNEKVTLLEREIYQSNFVLYCGVLDLHILDNIISYCDKLDRPIVLRTTGEIRKVNDSLELLLPKVTSVLVHSENNSGLLSTISPQNINIIDQTTLQESALLNIPIPTKKNLVYGYLGRFSKEKGVVKLLEIFKNYNLDIIVAGSGNLENEVLELMGEREHFLGELSQENIAVFFNKIDILVIASHEEAGPLVGIEAMAAGKLIFSTKVGAMQERLKNTENDFWFDINKEASFLELIEKLKQKSPEEINEIRKINRIKYLENYSNAIVEKQYLNLFQKRILK